MRTTRPIRRWTCIATLALAAAFAPAVHADAPTITITTNMSDVDGYTGDHRTGELGVTQFSGFTAASQGPGVSVPGNVFQTFCLEVDETVISGIQYSWTLSDAAHAGGGGAVNGADPISPETAYLYSAFSSGTLSDYDLTLGAGRRASADSLQLAIWYLEGEFTIFSLDSQALVWVEEAQSAVASGSWSGIGDVRVLTLTDSTGAAAQDVLVVTADSTVVRGGGGLTLGFWGNKHGQALIGADDLALLVSLDLRNANGSNFDPASKSALRTWLLKGTATNMAYMLSVQLAAMELNVHNGFVNAGALVYAPGCGNTGPGNGQITIGDLMAAANVALGVDGSTPSGDAHRAYQECLKDALDDANNNRNFVNP
jgi:hypothetical protein